MPFLDKIFDRTVLNTCCPITDGKKNLLVPNKLYSLKNAYLNYWYRLGTKKIMEELWLKIVINNNGYVITSFPKGFKWTAFEFLICGDWWLIC